MHYASRRTAAFRRSPSSRDRQGATIVVVAVVMVVLFAFTAFAIDFGRAYVSQAQLQTSADAAALAGAYELRVGRPGTGSDSAFAMARRNKVQSIDPDVLSLEPGVWDDGARVFTAAADWNTPGLNAVRATTGHELPYTFARAFGFSDIELSRPAVAAVGYSSSTSCVRPWAMDYRDLLAQLPSAPTSTDYELTVADVEFLVSCPGNKCSKSFDFGEN